MLFIPRSQFSFFNWLRGHLLPCPFKYLTGIDCPGCGFQRSLLALLQGHLSRSLQLYPATLPILIALVFATASRKFKIDTANAAVKKSIYLVAGAVIIVSYGIKMYYRYSVSV